MEITREQLLARREQVMVDHLQVVGHLQELDYWLAQLDREAASPPPGELPEPPKTEELPHGTAGL
jgi:hypothetical protein